MTPGAVARRAVYWCGIAAAAVAAFAAVAHVVGPESNKLIILSSFVPLMLVVGVVGLVALATVRAWKTLAVATVVVLAGMSMQVPLYVRDTPDTIARDGEIRLLQANIRLGEADLDALVETVRSRAVDMLTVEELTDTALARLREAGLEDVLPETYLVPKGSGGGGTGLYTRFPLRDPELLGDFSMANLVTKLDVGEGRTVTLAAVHPMPPYPSPSWMWATEMEKLRTLLHQRASDGDPVVVSGDFNSTFSHSRYRDILTDGFADAGEQAGAGLVPTYPADRWFPPVIAIDRIVLKNAVVGEYERVELPGSDHFGIFTTVTPEFAEAGVAR